MDAIRIHQLTKYYGKARGIIDVDLTIKEGEFFGFIGPNGAGKSTTIRILLGLISPTKGSASIFEKDILKDKDKVLSEVGYLPSEAVFYSGMKVKDILKLSADLRKKDCSAEAKNLCERLQLDMDRKVDELSFGNRKKVGIVCALQHNPRLLILDEPTSGLDPLMQKEFFDILQERNRKGVTIFLSSHILSEIQKNCQRAAIIREGKIIACDSVDALAKTKTKRVTVSCDLSAEDFLKNMQPDGFEIKNINTTGEGVEFLFAGDINALIKMLSEMKIRDLTLSELDLDEIFMHYYTDGGEV